MEMYPDQVYSKPEFTALPPYLFSGADFALIPSRDEPFGLVAVEFGRKGALGVGSRLGGLGLMPGWVSIRDDSWSHALMVLCSGSRSNPRRRRTCCRNYRKRSSWRSNQRKKNVRFSVLVLRSNDSQLSNGANAWKICIAGVSRRVVELQGRTRGGSQTAVSRGVN